MKHMARPTATVRHHLIQANNARHLSLLWRILHAPRSQSQLRHRQEPNVLAPSSTTSDILQKVAAKSSSIASTVWPNLLKKGMASTGVWPSLSDKGKASTSRSGTASRQPSQHRSRQGPQTPIFPAEKVSEENITRPASQQPKPSTEPAESVP